MANSNDPFIARRNGFNQAAAADLARFAQDRPGGAVDSQDNQNSQGEYLRDVLNGASPVDIVDHGLGPFEDKAMHFQPSGFGVVSILNVSQHNIAFAKSRVGSTCCTYADML